VNLFRIIALLKQIDPPPSLYSEPQFRMWFEETADVIADIAALSDDESGKRAAQMMIDIGRENYLWQPFYAVLLAAREVC
jgi:hypothetical protein